MQLGGVGRTGKVGVGGGGVGRVWGGVGGGHRAAWSYLAATSSVNLSTRWVRMLRGMVPARSARRGGLLFRHAGRVELRGGLAAEGGGLPLGPTHERPSDPPPPKKRRAQGGKGNDKRKHMQEAPFKQMFQKKYENAVDT